MTGSFRIWASTDAPPTLDVKHGAQIMRLTKNRGMLLLGIWLLIHGLDALGALNFEGLGTIEAVLALVAGILIMVDR